MTLGVAQLLTAGTGAQRQRQTMMNNQNLTAVVLDAINCTHGTPARRVAGPGASKPAE
ncbi:hypothetical protein [Arthrobacter globiformis]|uniref:hypothetical protein n=1 Tax=Arthrobacter globiformis TaxID=1665 RepID=UPI00167D5747|nr:hypothetical protein [Arthrobacter globiformis]